MVESAVSFKKTCEKCHRTIDIKNFYTYKNGEKVELCKKCLTMHIVNTDPKTFLPLLRKLDVPYIKKEWDNTYKKAYEKNPATINSMSVFGKYLVKMKLKQWLAYGWEDTEKLQVIANDKDRVGMLNSNLAEEGVLDTMLAEGSIDQATYDKLSSSDQTPQIASIIPCGNGLNPEDLDITKGLTQEDRIQLSLKWGNLYRTEQQVRMEKFYTDMVDSFDVQGAAREDQVKKLAVLSVKMDETLEQGDVDGFKKLSSVYDQMSKAGKFTEAQNKDGNSGFVNSVGELVALCEKQEGFIPKFSTDTPQDKVDKTIQDMQSYTYSLIMEDLGLGQQIEDTIKKIQEQRAADEDEEQDSKISSEVDDAEQEVLSDALSDDDVVDYLENVQNQRELDDKMIVDDA